jgi:methyltransferase (TIGR00027 family)
MEAEPSRTAIFAAIARGSLRLDFAPPWVFDDPFAPDLVGSAWSETKELLVSTLGVEVFREASAFVGMRSRLTEDRLGQGPFDQYVILGAGLDSFVWRRPDLVGSLKVFEVDHPATQAWKRERTTELALPVSDAHFFVPVDFEVESLDQALDAAGFDWTKPSMFSWLGVTPYLSPDAIEATLRLIGGAARGTEVVFDYKADASILDDNGRKFLEVFSRLAAQAGEPIQDGWTAADIEELIVRCGLQVADHPSRDETRQRYFANRTDALVPYTAQSVVAATKA